MTMYDQDPDVLRWGLHLLCGDPFLNSAYCTTSTCNYDREGGLGMDCTVFGSDETVAHALEEEFSQFAVSESSASSNADVEDSRSSVLEHDWFANDGSQTEEEDMEQSSSSSSSEEDDGSIMQLHDGFPLLDGEVGLRLNQMVPIPHVPRINGDIPSVDEATSDHHRLIERLSLYDLVEHKVLGDGNCQFRALSDQIYRTTEHHEFVRQEVVKQLRCYPDLYDGYVPMLYSEYLEKLSRNGEWGDHVTLQAAADLYGLKILVITSFKDTCYIEIVPNFQKSERVICLSFWAEVHYNSIYPQAGADLPTSATKRKWSWWPFGYKN